MNKPIVKYVCFSGELSTIFKCKIGQRLRQSDMLYSVMFNLDKEIVGGGNIPGIKTMILIGFLLCNLIQMTLFY